MLSFFFPESQNMVQGLTLPMVIGVFVGVSAIVVIAVLFVISFANRRFYSKQIRENAYYVGSVVSEHVTTTLCRVPEQRSDICDENIPTDNNTYMLAIREHLILVLVNMHSFVKHLLYINF